VDTVDDPFRLQRFVTAQDPCYADVLAQLRGGRKTSHWMWFVFPQLRGLGASAMATRYGLGSLAEAQAYDEHPVLGPRLRECVELVLAVESRTARQIFGTPDDMKFRSSMTLFAIAASSAAPFRAALDRFYQGLEDPRTLAMLR
jgi:uncharacterized protein (DUF1810 family)